MRHWFLVLPAIVICVACGGCGPEIRTGESNPGAYFRIRAIDRETGRGVPMVRFTVDSASIVHYTDSAGVIAFLEPGLMGEMVYFLVEGHGYEVPLDHHGHRALALRVEAGGEAVVELDRRHVGQRLYRISGLGRYRDSLLLGDVVLYSAPTVKNGVLGQDSVYITPYRDKLFWLWGDTFTPMSILYDSNHEVTCALSGHPGPGTFDPEYGVVLDYFGDGGLTRKMIAPRDGGTMTWCDGLVNLGDAEGHEQLFALFVQMRRAPLDETVPTEHVKHPMTFWWSDDHRAEFVELARLRELGEEAVREYRERMAAAKERYTKVTRGLLQFDEASGHFHVVAEFPFHEIDELHIGSQPLRVDDTVYFCGLFPNRRVHASAEAIRDIDNYESFTCLKQGARFDNTAQQLDRHKDGSLHWSWKRDTSPIGPRQQKQLVEAGHIESEERWIVFRDIESEREIRTQHNTIRWNAHRQRFVGLFTERDRSLGETWYAEADSSTGPWVYMRKAISFGGYSFYNPCHFFSKDNGREIFVEGTFTKFMGRQDLPYVPRYQYNQMMVKIDLDDPRLVLPVPVYELENPRRYMTKSDILADDKGPRVPVFFAPDRPSKWARAIYARMDSNGMVLTREPGGKIAFYAETFGVGGRPWAKALYEFRHTENGARVYSILEDVGEGFKRVDAPFCRVWPNPSKVNPFE